MKNGVVFRHFPFDEQNYESACSFFEIGKLDFDAFNERYNGLTKAQYLQYIQPNQR